MATDRRHARVLAMQALCQWDVQRDESPESLQAYMLASEASAKPVRYASELVRTFWSRREEIDRRLSEASPNWEVGRMSPVERNVMRVTVVEWLTAKVPPKVALNEAIEIAGEYADDNARRFVNGILDEVLKGLAVEPKDHD